MAAPLQNMKTSSNFAAGLTLNFILNDDNASK